MSEAECRELGKSLVGQYEDATEVRAWCKKSGYSAVEEHHIADGFKMAVPIKGRRAFIRL